MVAPRPDPAASEHVPDLPERDDATSDATFDATSDDACERRSAAVPAALHGERLDKAVVALAPEFSRNHLQTLIESGHVWLDAAPAVTASRKVRAGQKLEVELVPTAQSRAFRAEAMALAIVHEDEHVIVIDKPAGLVVHPAAGHWSGTLMNGLLAWHDGAVRLPRAGIVHRLDKDTSGLMVVAKTLPAMTALVRAIAAREVKRDYLALAHGAWPAGRLRIDAPVGRDPASRVRMAVVASGKPAQTDFERFAQCSVDGRAVSALRCTLQTGRTHQIRVHAASRGHPLIGDAAYGGAPALGLERQALHARRLAFAHPLGGQWLVFEAVPPADFDTAWRLVCGQAGDESV